MNSNVLFFLLGPTCVGKTSLSLNLFNYFPLEIINVDSSMIYSFMNVGTGKPNFCVRNKFKHHLIDIKHPTESYSAWNFCLDSSYIILDCLNRNKIPFFVGGTMMYAWYLQKFLLYFLNNYKLDNNLLFSSNSNFFLNFSFVNIFLLPFNKDIFFCKIKSRVLNMLDNGFLDEVIFLKSILNSNYNFNSIKSIGYKDLFLYLDGKISFSSAINSIFESTFRLAESQIKWIKKFNSNSFFIENKDKFFLKKCIDIINLY